MPKANGFLALRAAVALLAVLLLALFLHGQFAGYTGSDADGDTLDDGWETCYGFDATAVQTDGVHGAWDDPDMDQLSNYGEMQGGADPFCWDTDGDFMSDGWEAGNVMFGLSPTVDDSSGDADMDGLSNVEEVMMWMTDPLNWDSDMDGVSDGAEVYLYGTDPAVWNDPGGGMGGGGGYNFYSDADLDGLSDGDEYYMWMTDPWCGDTDMDGLSDGDEVYMYGTGPTSWDTDMDMLPDAEELFMWMTGPLSWDTDMDGFSDGDEVYLYYTSPTCWDPPQGGTGDSDMDGLSDGDEGTWMTDLWNWDTDWDMLSDGDEVYVYGSNPTSSDTDMDGLWDNDEIWSYGTYPSAWDSDMDGVSDWDEIFVYGTSPTGYDSDNDGMPDYWEFANLMYGLNPASDDSGGDTDLDGLPNYAEFVWGTSLWSSDTDTDGLSDGYEVAENGTSPANWDTDGDGLSDGDEILWAQDSDGDGLSDGWEIQNAMYGFDPAVHDGAGDADGDGLSNAVELALGTDVLNQDSDMDGVMDGADAFPADPSVSVDTDGDGAPDAVHQGWATGWITDAFPFDPTAWLDSDGDGAPDWFTCVSSSEPTLVLDLDPWNPDIDGDGLSDGPLDPDGGGPITAGPDPDALNPDTDGDWLSDGPLDPDGEGPILAGPDPAPHNPDMDYDGIRDGWEVRYSGYMQTACYVGMGFDLFIAEAVEPLRAQDDPDGDSLNNADESEWGTDPFSPDSDGDGMNDGWEARFSGDISSPCYTGMGFDPAVDNYNVTAPLRPQDDPDGEDLSNLDESARGTNPFSGDTDGDGLFDSEEISLHWTDPNDADTDMDGVVDGVEVAFNFNPNAVESELFSDTNGDGMCDWLHLLSGVDPAAPSTADPYLGAPATGLDAWELFPGVWMPAVPPEMDGQTLLSRTVTVAKTGPWQLFYLAGSPDGTSILCGQGMEITCEVNGETILLHHSNSLGVVPVFLGNSETATVTVTIHGGSYDWTPGNSAGFSGVYLVRWSADVWFSGVWPHTVATPTVDGARYVVAAAGDDGAPLLNYQLDLTSHPSRDGNSGSGGGWYPLSEDELAELDNPPASLGSGLSLFSPMDVYGGGTVAASQATLATLKVPDAEHPVRLAFVKPEAVRSEGSPEPLGKLAGSYPLDSASLRGRLQNAFTAAGSSGRSVTVTSGLEGFDLPAGLLNVSIGGVSGSTYPIPAPTVQSACGPLLPAPGDPNDPCGCVECEPDDIKVCMTSGDTVIWHDCVDDYDDSHDEDLRRGSEDESECGCDSDGTDLGSLKFRVSLGGAGRDALAGFVWLALDTPQAISPALFRVLAAPGVTVATNGSTVTVTSPDRIAVIAPTAGSGVQVTVSIPGVPAPALHSLWTITNLSDNAVHVVRTGGAEGSDETFAFDAPSGRWSRADNLRGVSESLVAATSADGRRKTEIRTVTDASTGTVLSESSETRELVGPDASAVARVTEKTDLSGSSFFTYWEDADNPRRNGKLKLRSGDTDWQYQDVDDRGRPALTAGPLDGSLPGDLGTLEPASPEDLALLGAVCLATARSYEPDAAAGDSCALADRDKAREIASYAVRDGEARAVSRTRLVYSRAFTPEDIPTLTVRTVRFPDPDSRLQPPHVSVRTSFAGSEVGNAVPSALWGLPLAETDGDGATRSWHYAFGDYDEASGEFFAAASGAALRVIALSSGSETFEVEIRDAARGLVRRSETRLLQADPASDPEILLAGSVPLSWSRTVFDNSGRERATFFSDGTASSNDYGECGCRLAAAFNRDGTRTEHWADPANPLWSATAVPAAIPDTYTVTEIFRDGLGRLTNSVRCVWNGRFPGGSRDPACAPLQTLTEYPDGHSDVRVVTAPTGLSTSHETTRDGQGEREWASDGGGGYTESVRVRGGSASSERFWDWHLEIDALTGSFDYTYKSRRETRASAYGGDGLRTETAVSEASDCVPVTTSVTVSDGLGRVLSVSTPAFGGGRLVSSNFYDGATSRVLRRSTTGSPDTLYVYTPEGEPAATALDANGNGVIDLAGPDRVTATREGFETDAAGAWWRATASILYPESGSPVPLTNALTRVRLTGLGAAWASSPMYDAAFGIPQDALLTAQTETLDWRGNVTRVSTLTDAASAAVWTVTETPGSSRPAFQKTVDGRLAMTASAAAVTNLFSYDAMNRQTAATDGRGNTAVTHYNALGQVDWTEDAAANRTSYVYDLQGRVTAVTDALGNTVHTAYDGVGNVSARWGATYPVAYDYDSAGRLATLITARDDASASWIGYMSLDDIFCYLFGANPNDPMTFLYHFDVTSWLYDPATGMLTNKVYADGSGPSYAYDAFARLVTRTWARGVTTAYGYDALGQLASVGHSDATPDVAYTYDRLGRRLTAVTAGTSSSEYAYSGLDLAAETQNGEVIIRESDAFGRPRTLSLSAYGYPCYTSENVYDPLSGRLTAVQTHAYNGSLENPLYADQWFGYAYLPGSDLPQSVAGSAWDDAVGQWVPALTTVRAYEAARDLVSIVSNDWGAARAPVRTYAYQNDAAGRRTLRLDFDGAQFAGPNVFGYNARSEVTSAMMGTHGYSYDYDPMGNRVSSEADGETATYAANALNQYSAVTYPSNSPQPNSLSYDADGNLLAYGPWTYTWDAENRMSSACSNGVLLVANVYDHQSRRIRKEVHARADATCNYEPVTCNVFLYDGWNVISEGSWDSATAQWGQTFYAWGLDLSGSMQGAGGVGGLLAVTAFREDAWGSESGATHFPTYDANGNVTAYLDAQGATAGAFEYDAFGNTVSETWNLSPETCHLPHRFSTKYLDAETGMYYYGYRFYHPELGRWVNRDPIGEDGGFNLYGFCNNRTCNLIDVYGSYGWAFDARAELIFQDQPIDYPGNARSGSGMAVEVSYTLDETEQKCCKRVLVNRWVRKILGVTGATSGDYWYDQNIDAALAVAGFPKGSAPTDNPEGPSIYGYRIGWTQQYKWESVCIKGAWAGKVLSTIEATYYSEGHWSRGDFNGWFVGITDPTPDSSKYQDWFDRLTY